FNDQSVYVVRRDILYALDRDDGKHQLFTVDKDTDLTDYGFGLEFAPSCTPVADNDYLFVCIGERLVRYVVPDFRLAQKLQAELGQTAKKKGSPQPIRQWSFNAFDNLSLRPIVNLETLVLTTDGGTVYMIDKDNPREDIAVVYGKFQTEGPVISPPAYDKSIMYIPCADYYLYALDTYGNKLLWRFAGQAPIVETPRATDADVFVKVSKGGIFRVDRATGEARWASKDAVKFLATNQKFVYALDSVGNMLIVDYLRGKTMAAWDARNWIVSIGNDLTDRIYLASHDGQILCLRNKDNVKPLVVKTFEVPKSKDKDGKKKADEIPPKVEPPKVEPPKVEPPKVEAPKVEPPKVEAPKVDDKAPKKDDKAPPKGEDKAPKKDDKGPPKGDDKAPKGPDNGGKDQARAEPSFIRLQTPLCRVGDGQPWWCWSPSSAFPWRCRSAIC
ncbi:MAG TPA: PQQ-binding-like beta-propeller repeat protein, partial [Gemmataceae bacterium]|nr:PQQ-binding-like beta-propeller repeat protein [Gemmataceae bacterium]